VRLWVIKGAGERWLGRSAPGCRAGSRSRLRIASLPAPGMKLRETERQGASFQGSPPPAAAASPRLPPSALPQQAVTGAFIGEEQAAIRTRLLRKLGQSSAARSGGDGGLPRAVGAIATKAFCSVPAAELRTESCPLCAFDAQRSFPQRAEWRGMPILAGYEATVTCCHLGYKLASDSARSARKPDRVARPRRGRRSPTPAGNEYRAQGARSALTCPASRRCDGEEEKSSGRKHTTCHSHARHHGPVAPRQGTGGRLGHQAPNARTLSLVE